MESKPPQAIGQTYAVKSYRMNRRLSMPATTRVRLLKHPPVIAPQEFPTQTMCRIFRCQSLVDSLDYDVMRGHLQAYAKHGDGRKWDEYRMKIPPALLETWTTVMIECRRNGFINPHVWEGKIVFDQVIATGYCEDTDPCTMCDRPCQLRERIDSGESKRRKLLDPNYREKQPCWINHERQPGEEG